MSLLGRLWIACIAISGLLLLSACQGLKAGPAPPTAVQLTVTETGAGTGTVTSNPAGINCGQTCTATFNTGTTVTLTATPDAGFAFGGWSGACSGTGTCALPVSGPATVTATFTASLQSINHIVFMMQENRGFDHYFGALRAFWAANGFSDVQFDGLPQFNSPAGTTPSNPGCDPAFPFNPPTQTNDCMIDANSPNIQSFHMTSVCVENPSPSWNESHNDLNHENPVAAPTPTGPLDGFVWTAAHDARNNTPTPLNDVNGVRAMGHYDGGDLNYYYFMASSFATSDRWFSPVMSRTQPNRMYSLAATSAGHAYPLLSGATPLPNKTIFDALQAAGVSWKVYVTDLDASPPQQDSSLNSFVIASQFPQNFVPASHFATDAASGSLPQVAMIDPGYNSGLDEHPAEDPTAPGGSVQVGANYVSTLINALMTSPSWKDSVFILTWDEDGGFYDHVTPQAAMSPDGIPPSDLLPGDVCTQVTGPTCDFVFTGFRVPLIVVSPFAQKHFVSHTVADYTAILKFIETRFNVPSLTKRDAAQMDMTEFFDFVNDPWKTPPTNIPAQNTGGSCNLNPPQP